MSPRQKHYEAAYEALAEAFGVKPAPPTTMRESLNRSTIQRLLEPAGELVAAGADPKAVAHFAILAGGLCVGDNRLLAEQHAIHQQKEQEL